MPASLKKSSVRKLKQGVRAGLFSALVVERMASDVFAIIYCFGLGTDGQIELPKLLALLSQHPTWAHLDLSELTDLVSQLSSAKCHTIVIEDGRVLI